jgi:hypothetical protein
MIPTSFKSWLLGRRPPRLRRRAVCFMAEDKTNAVIPNLAVAGSATHFDGHHETQHEEK